MHSPLQRGSASHRTSTCLRLAGVTVPSCPASGGASRLDRESLTRLHKSSQSSRRDVLARVEERSSRVHSNKGKMKRIIERTDINVRTDLFADNTVRFRESDVCGRQTIPTTARPMLVPRRADQGQPVVPASESDRRWSMARGTVVHARSAEGSRPCVW